MATQVILRRPTLGNVPELVRQAATLTQEVTATAGGDPTEIFDTILARLVENERIDYSVFTEERSA